MVERRVEALMPIGSRFVFFFVYNPFKTEDKLLNDFIIPESHCPKSLKFCNYHPIEVRLARDDKCLAVMQMIQRSGNDRRQQVRDQSSQMRMRGIMNISSGLHRETLET